MRTTRICGRGMALALTFGTFAALSGPATACEGKYTIQPGDTLSRVASKCDTTVSALSAANRVNPRSLQLGQVITIPGSEASEPVARESSRTRPATEPVAEDATGYVVRAGDTPAGIASFLGISLDTLMAANDGLDPTRLRIGQHLNVPDNEEVKAILAEREAERARLERIKAEYADPALSARKGEWRLTVDLEANGLSPNETVRVAVSGGDGEWITLGEMPADEKGRMIARARIPAELVGAPTLEWAIERPWGEQVAVAYDGTATKLASRSRDRAPAQDTLTVSGKIVSGGDCDLLVTADGESYQLGGRATGLRPGAKVIVTGALDNASGSGCMGGQGSLLVQAIEASAS